MPAIPGDITSPIRFIALGSADNIASAGLISCDVALNLFAYTCPGGDTYAAFAATAQQSFIFFSHFIPLSVATGDGVFFSIYDDRVGNELHFVITLPDGTSSAFGVDAHGADYTMAAAMANWSGSTPQLAGPALGQLPVGTVPPGPVHHGERSAGNLHRTVDAEPDQGHEQRVRASARDAYLGARLSVDRREQLQAAVRRRFRSLALHLSTPSR